MKKKKKLIVKVGLKLVFVLVAAKSQIFRHKKMSNDVMSEDHSSIAPIISAAILAQFWLLVASLIALVRPLLSYMELANQGIRSHPKIHHPGLVGDLQADKKK